MSDLFGNQIVCFPERRLICTYIGVFEDKGVGNVLEETGELGKSHRPWMGDHYTATCLGPDLNPNAEGKKKCVIHDAIQALTTKVYQEFVQNKMSNGMFQYSPNPISNVQTLRAVYIFDREHCSFSVS